MIAVYGVRGAPGHRYRHVTTKAEAEAFFDECRAGDPASNLPTELLADPMARGIYLEANPIFRINKERVAHGLCRHCGGRVPCWSEFGDVAAGVQHTRRSMPSVTRSRRQRSRQLAFGNFAHYL